MLLKDFLKEMRIKDGLTQRALAAKIGIHGSLLSQYEMGKIPRYPNLKKILDFANNECDMKVTIKDLEF